MSKITNVKIEVGSFSGYLQGVPPGYQLNVYVQADEQPVLDRIASLVYAELARVTASEPARPGEPEAEGANHADDL